MRVKQKTKDLAFIRRQIREAISWNKVDDGSPNFWTTDNYKGSRIARHCKGRVMDYPYYTKSDRAIVEITKRIYDKLKGENNNGA